ncbi:MAG: DUF6492 family protein [Cyanobacteria bacterium P01_D01_bin.128]
MTMEPFDFVIPLFKLRWNTRAVLEGLTTHYRPRAIHVIAPAAEANALAESAGAWQSAPLFTHPEETFFGLSKDEICAEIDLGKSLYTPGWFYQQLLKLGASEGIEGLSEWYAVWDSDLLPVATWPLIQTQDGQIKHSFALIQHNQYGNAKIVAAWAHWIRTILEVEPITDPVGTFIPHHMWFKQGHLAGFKAQIQRYFQSEESWLLLMMRSANTFDTFGEYWCYSSWVAAKAPEDLSFYSYERYGATTERFFDDGTGLFSKALRKALQISAPATAEDGFSPSYTAVDRFIQAEYGPDELPSSLSFESSPRHLKKNKANLHIEESRSRWNPRMAGTSESLEPQA